MRHLPVLPARDAVDEIEIASPCTVPWDSMRGTELVRFCGQCHQNVYNVHSFTRPEARRLIEAQEGRRCVRILRRDDGTVVTADCWTRLRAARRRGWLAVAAVLVMIAWTQVSAMRFGWQLLTDWWKPGPAPCSLGEASPERRGLVVGELQPQLPVQLQGVSIGLPPIQHDVAGKPSAPSKRKGHVMGGAILGRRRP
jgi:hypothetical protein